MILKKLTLQNIRSYKSLIINFPLGSTLLAGEIGSGKTSILLGLQFALFGLQPGQRGNSILRQGESEAYACLEFEVDERQVTLERTIKKSKSGSITQEFNAITIDNQREELSTSEMKERVVSLLNYPREFIKKSNLLYKFTIYTPQEEMKAIIQENASVRLDTLRHVFGIDRYKRIKDNAQILSQRLKEIIKIKEVLVSELNLLKEKLVIEKEKKILLSKETNNLLIEHANLKNMRDNSEQKVSRSLEKMEEKKSLDSEILRLKAELNGKKDLELRMKRDIMSMQKQLNMEIDFSPERIFSVNRLLEKHKEILEQKTEEYLEVSSKISALESKKEGPITLREKIMGIENCPTCLQGVAHEHKQKISKKAIYEIEEINRELEQKIVEKNILVKDIEEEKRLVRAYEQDKALLEQNKIKFDHRREIETKLKSDSFILDRIRNEIAQINGQVDKLSLRRETFSQIQESFEKAKKEFEEINELFRKKEILIATKKKELEIKISNVSDLEKEILRKEEVRKQIDFFRSLQDWITDKFFVMIDITEKNVMNKLRVEFSRIFGEWFSMLVSDNLTSRLDEDFTPVITNQDYEIDYEFLSGGERTATALAYRLALNQVLNSMLSRIKTKDLIILDEPTDGFASEQIDKMRDIFEQLRAEQIILVSHEQKMEGFVDYVIKVRKDLESRIEIP